MRIEDLKPSPDQIELLQSLDAPLSAEEFTQQFPFLLRSLSIDNPEGAVTCNPQPGEMYRFGVYFFALPRQEGHQKFVYNNSSFILIPSDSFFSEAGIDENILHRGIAVQQSEYYQGLVESKKNGKNVTTASESIDHYRAVEEENITLDYGKTLIGIGPPVFSVPQSVQIDRKYLHSQLG